MDYFAYASNLNKAQMKQRCPDAKPKFSSVLPNYKLVFTGWSRTTHGSTATIQPFKGARVSGAVYEITEAAFRKLDKFEDYPGTYTHLNVTVFNEDDVAVKAITYVKTRQEDEGKPSPEYIIAIKQGLKDWELE
jgi:gamma-glutamylcyclotransferase